MFPSRDECGLGGLDAWVHAAKREHLGRGPQVGGVAAVQRSYAQRHPHLLPQVTEVAGCERDEERGAGDRTIDPRDVRRARTQLLG